MKAEDQWKSPLRYPGGKQRESRWLTQFFPKNRAHIEYREPFLGGGSVLLAAKALGFGGHWANDVSEDVFNFWRCTKFDARILAWCASRMRDPYDGPAKKCPEWDAFKADYKQWLNTLPTDNAFLNAAKFFVLNRSTASGLTNSGGMTAAAYKERFTQSAIDRLAELHGALDGVDLTCGDYEPLLMEPPRKDCSFVFLFLDPPYYSAEKSGLYGKSGDLHKGFDHDRLAESLRKCSHFWLMTIDDCDRVRQLYDWADIQPWTKPYSMANKGGKSKKGMELLVASPGILETK